jgi:hypothetical protein
MTFSLFRFPIGWVLLLFACPTFLFGQEEFFNPREPGREYSPDEVQAYIPNSLFGEGSILELRIESDFTHLEATKEAEEYQPAVLRVKYSDSLFMRKRVEIRARGNSRKKYCEYPPFKIRFKQTDSAVSEFSRISDLKVVSQCHPHPVYESYLLREYLAYQIYQLLCPISYGTRLVRILYVDKGKKGKSWEQYGFLIEDDEMIAERLALREVDHPDHPVEQIHPDNLARVSLIQFLLGNTDWNITNGHNIKYFQRSPDPQDTLFILGYDFDLTGFVDPAYGVPSASLKMTRMQDRRFIGCEIPETSLWENLQAMFDQKQALQDLIDGFDPLSFEERNNINQYLQTVFRLEKKEGKRERVFLKNCTSYYW